MARSTKYLKVYLPGHHRATRQWPRGTVAEHVLIAEQALGKDLPLRHPVHHVNEDGTDNRNCNLVICESQAYHALLHVRMRVLKAGGDPNTEKICGDCKKIRPKSLFYRDLRYGDGLSKLCLACRRVRQEDWRSRNRLKLQQYARSSQQYRNEWRRRKRKELKTMGMKPPMNEAPLMIRNQSVPRKKRDHRAKALNASTGPMDKANTPVKNSSMNK